MAMQDAGICQCSLAHTGIFITKLWSQTQGWRWGELFAVLFHQHLVLNRRWSPLGISHWFQTCAVANAQCRLPASLASLWGRPGRNLLESTLSAGWVFLQPNTSGWQNSLFSQQVILKYLIPYLTRAAFFLHSTVLWWSNPKVKSCHYVVQFFLRKKGKRNPTPNLKSLSEKGKKTLNPNQKENYFL